MGIMILKFQSCIKLKIPKSQRHSLLLPANHVYKDHNLQNDFLFISEI